MKISSKFAAEKPHPVFMRWLQVKSYGEPQFYAKAGGKSMISRRLTLAGAAGRG